MATFENEFDKAKKKGQLGQGKSAGQIIRGGVSSIAQNAPKLGAGGSFSIPKGPSNQRNQAAAGSAGTTTGDSSGTGANTPTSTSTPTPTTQRNISQPTLGFENIKTIDPSAQFLEDRSRAAAQRTADRGFETQTTQLGATAGDGSRLASNGGTLSTVGSQRDPRVQLANLRETFGTSGGPSRNASGSSGFAIAPDTATRERNARMNDPRNEFLSNLDRQVRRGAISARAAGGIAANILGQQADVTTARERIAADQLKSQNDLGFKRDELDQESTLAREKLASDAETSRLGNISDELIANQKAASEAAKLGLDRQEFAELQRKNRAGEAIDTAKLSQAERFKIADLAQNRDIQSEKTATSRLSEVSNILGKLNEGLPVDQGAAQLTELVGPETAERLLGQAGIGLFGKRPKKQ